ncbi:MAG TPA: hypothetical protein VHM70_09420 [Polyangiaceae bacterium]|jgi:hypothetical protein|nr:hypothetical protein [Polyangiaceae bacterium]
MTLEANQAKAHLATIAAVAWLVALFGIPAACFGGCVLESAGLALGLSGFLYVALWVLIIHWFRYRAKNPQLSVPAQTVFMILLTLGAAMVLVAAISVMAS